jgi:hypothetical protein
MKTTSFLKGFAIAAAAVFFGSCQQLYIETQPEVEIKMTTDARETYTFSGSNPQPATFSIGSTTPWEITGYEAAEWLSVKPAASALSSLSADVTLTAVPNETYEQRSVTLTLKGEGIEKVWTIEVVQGMKSKFFVQPITEEFEGAGSSLPFTVETNLAWEVRAADAWLTFDKTSGTGTGAIETITATAAENPGVERTTTVTVTAGAETETFTVLQKGGKTLEFVTTELEMISYAGGEALLDVNASMDWTVTTDAAWLTVEKAGAQVKVTAPANSAFAARTAVVTIAGDGLTAEVELTQDTPFELTEGCEILADGSVKVNGGSKAKIHFKDGFRYHRTHIELGETNWGSNGEMWYHLAINECNIYNQHRSKNRMRTDGDTSAGSTYLNTTYDLDDAKLAAAKSFDYAIYPDAQDPTQLHFEWSIDGEVFVDHVALNAIHYAPAEMTGKLYFGNYNTTDADTYYVIKSCTITPIAE